jgi:hypothetical protein
LIEQRRAKGSGFRRAWPGTGLALLVGMHDREWGPDEATFVEENMSPFIDRVDLSVGLDRTVAFPAVSALEERDEIPDVEKARGLIADLVNALGDADFDARVTDVAAVPVLGTIVGVSLLDAPGGLRSRADDPTVIARPLLARGDTLKRPR